MMTLYKTFLSVFLDFTNFTAKPNIRAIAEADDHEVVREVQVNIGHGYMFF